MAGYYILRLVDITAIRAQVSEDRMLDEILEALLALVSEVEIPGVIGAVHAVVPRWGRRSDPVAPLLVQYLN